MTKSILGRDINGNVTYTLPPCANKSGLLLLQDADQTVTVPSTAGIWDVYFCVEPGSEVWAAYDDTAEYPTGSIITSSEMNPAGRRLNGGTDINLITPNTTARLSVIMYAVQ